jgi:hypothetical protein
MSPHKDFFVEGQLSIRTIKDVKAMNQLSRYQQEQSKRLASPARVNVNYSYCHTTTKPEKPQKNDLICTLRNTILSKSTNQNSIFGSPPGK